jgi:hypothetical protein
MEMKKKERDKRNEELRDFVGRLIDMTNDEIADKKLSTNDVFDVATWYWNQIVESIAQASIIPVDNLEFRVGMLMRENIDKLFKILKEDEEGN